MTLYSISPEANKTSKHLIKNHMKNLLFSVNVKKDDDIYEFVNVQKRHDFIDGYFLCYREVAYKNIGITCESLAEKKEPHPQYFFQSGKFLSIFVCFYMF